MAREITAGSVVRFNDSTEEMLVLQVNGESAEVGFDGVTGNVALHMLTLVRTDIENLGHHEERAAAQAEADAAAEQQHADKGASA